jgi:two-component system response regulator AtoC
VLQNAIETVRLLVVSRDSAVLRPLWAIGEANSWRLETAVSAWEAMERIHWALAPHLLVLDLPRGDGDSAHVARWLQRLRPDLPIILLCDSDDIGQTIKTTRLGAEDILVRPIDPGQLEILIHSHLVAAATCTTSAVSSEDIEQLEEDKFFLSASPATQKLRTQAELLAQADVPVLILGEPGSGKDTVARLIHKFSVRSGFDLLKVSCAAMPGELFENQLHSRSGGNDPTNLGKREARERGTILLDEITEMPLGLQSKLLLMLQGKPTFQPNGDAGAQPPVRVLASSSANLERAIAENKLREDLYFRLSAFTVMVPALRQRKEEITILLRCFMRKLSNHYGLPPREFSPAVVEACQHYAWPGNLTELESFVKRYLIVGDSELALNEPGTKPRTGRNAMQDSPIMVPAAARRDGADQRQQGPAEHSLKNLIRDVKSEAERNVIAAALTKTGWNRKAAARLLNVSYRTLLYKIDEYHMNCSEPAPRWRDSGAAPEAEPRSARKQANRG